MEHQQISKVLRKCRETKSANTRMNSLLRLSVSRIVAFSAVILCFFSLADGSLPQLQMYLLSGNVLTGNIVVKAALLVTAILGCLIYLRVQSSGLPLSTWGLCIVFLIADAAYLIFVRDMSLIDVLQSYNGYYLLLLIGPGLLAFRGAVPERAVIICTVFIFAVCAAIGLAQHFAAQPLLYTESSDGSFKVESWNFFGEVRAFSLFSSALDFGIFCALCGSLGVALSRTLRVRGTLLFLLSALACFTTLTRICYLVFICACVYAAVITFGKSARRGRWLPFLYFGLGLSTLWFGLRSFSSGEDVRLQDATSLIDRIVQWSYYADVIVHASPAQLLFGFGIVQNEKILPRYPMVIDNVALALLLHIGLIGLVVFGILMIKMWLYLRREALESQQPFLIAGVSLWATLACMGIFNIVFSSFGAVFALAILCDKNSSIKQLHTARNKNNYDEGSQTKRRSQPFAPVKET